MKILIKVTKEILSASCGCQRLSKDCVIARAVREIFPKACVLGHSIFIDKWDVGKEMELRERFEYLELPEKAYQLISAFDACSTYGEVMELPLIQFHVDVPDSIIEAIGISQVYKILSESKTLELVEI